MVSKANKTKDHTQILTEIKGELAVLNEHNEYTTNVNKRINGLLAGATLILVAFGFAEIATIANEPIFSGSQFYLGLLFGLFFVIGFVLTVISILMPIFSFIMSKIDNYKARRSAKR